MFRQFITVVVGLALSILCLHHGIPSALCAAGLLGGIEGRRKRPEYARLLSDCHQIYCEMRMLVMGPIVRDRVAAHAEAALTSLMRSGCSYLLQVCSRPTCIFLHPDLNMRSYVSPEAPVTCQRQEGLQFSSGPCKYWPMYGISHDTHSSPVNFQHACYS